MARATTKNEVIQTGNEKYQKLIDLINSLSKKDIDSVFNFDIENKKEAHWKRDKNIRDVIIHLYEWHQLLLNWVNTNQKGIELPFLKEGYNWKTYGTMNMEFWEVHQTTSYDTALQLLKKSHEQVMKLVNTFSNDELFSKGTFKWVGGSTLGSYFVSVSASHYDWAIKKINLYKKSLIS